jgi:hypothetical protein
MLTFEEAYTKFQTISGSANATDLVQAKQDINVGYKRFNAAIARYFTRKQGFTNLVADQQYYQTPIDAIRISSATYVQAGGTLQFPLEQVRSEDEWREMNIFPYSSSYIRYYFVYGNDQIGLFPIPSTTVTNGFRYVYQPQDIDLTKDDYDTGTITITNGSVTVTGSGTSWTQAQMGNMQFQVTDGSDGNWYEILAINSTTSLTLKTPYVGPSVAATTYRLGQMFIFPGEYDDVPVDYALSRFWESRNNIGRAKYHKQNYQDSVTDAIEKYASSSLSNVITGEDDVYNLWFAPPMPGA